MPPLPEIFLKGTHGFEPWTYRTAADCSTTELYPLDKVPEEMSRVGSQGGFLTDFLPMLKKLLSLD